MRCVIQRVSRASVSIEGKLVSAIERGYLVLVGVADGDTEQDMRYCADKVANLRIFEDENDKMNLSIADVGGAVLAVSQFTLLGDARHGRRPGFSAAARPEAAVPLYEGFCQTLRAAGLRV
ncbi:MAG: D-tyrosyl-tRNA(Tyr) deacylase, partial [Oscillospiraceae bacterium]|nr:D-tyrosyl-tRNA(Tyr) deacylase [Oscillospiraceae bacterium]